MNTFSNNILKDCNYLQNTNELCGNAAKATTSTDNALICPAEAVSETTPEGKKTEFDSSRFPFNFIDFPCETTPSPEVSSEPVAPKSLTVNSYIPTTEEALKRLMLIRMGLVTSEEDRASGWTSIETTEGYIMTDGNFYIVRPRRIGGMSSHGRIGTLDEDINRMGCFQTTNSSETEDRKIVKNILIKSLDKILVATVPTVLTYLGKAVISRCLGYDFKQGRCRKENKNGCK